MIKGQGPNNLPDIANQTNANLQNANLQNLNHPISNPQDLSPIRHRELFVRDKIYANRVDVMTEYIKFII